MTDWIDAHTHLDSEELYPRMLEVLKRAEEAGVRKVMLVNSEATRSSFQRTLECLRLRESIDRFASFGIHPHHAGMYDDELFTREPVSA